jgi:hypothetical protein
MTEVASKRLLGEPLSLLLLGWSGPQSKRSRELRGRLQHCKVGAGPWSLEPRLLASTLAFASAGNIEATKIPCDNCMSEPALEYGIWEHRDPRSRIRNISKPDNELFCMFGWGTNVLLRTDEWLAGSEMMMVMMVMASPHTMQTMESKGSRDRRQVVVNLGKADPTKERMLLLCVGGHHSRVRAAARHNPKRSSDRETSAAPSSETWVGQLSTSWLRRPLVDCLRPTSLALSSSSLFVSSDIFA